MAWEESERRVPRDRDIVKHIDGSIGIVKKTTGSLYKKFLTVDDFTGSEIYADEDANLFYVLDKQGFIDFHTKQYDYIGYRVGALCSFKKNFNIPLEIVKLEWNTMYSRMLFLVVDRREFNREVMKTTNSKLIELFDLNFPKPDNFFSDINTGLPFRIEVNLVETQNKGWTNCGSPWEFQTKESAMSEYESWKSRLKIRRAASIINTGWDFSFPAWTVDTTIINGEILTRVKEVTCFTGAPAYFKSALHAAFATKIIQSIDWLLASSFTEDALNL